MGAPGPQRANEGLRAHGPGEKRMVMNDRGERGVKRPDGGPSATASRQLQSHIGSQLRQMFDEVVQEPIPDRFQRLLADLDDPENAPRLPRASEP